MMKRTDLLWLLVVGAFCVLFPFILNWILLKESVVPVVGDGTTWLAFWPVYLSSIASFGMIFFTYRSLQQNKRQLEELRQQREEEERARIVFSVIVYQHAFMLKISNIGKRNVFNAVLHFNEDFLNELMEEKFEEAYRQLSSPFFVEAGTSRYLFIGFCQDINDAWKNKHVIIKISGTYNDIYTINEELDMRMFLDKSFILVQGDLETTMSQIKKGFVAPNDFHMPIQNSLEMIAESIKNVEASMDKVAEHFDETEEEEK